MQLSEMSVPLISEFFATKNVFITGATGFLGKALLEKLLRSCPDIGMIYILLRPKKEKQIEDRLHVLFNDKIYERLKKEQPNLLERKVTALAGDVTELNLGLSPKDRKLLTENVNIVFHVAASVRFDDSLYDSVIINVRGTREICQLSLDTRNLLAHIHVSTAYSNCDKADVKEQLYEEIINWKHMIEITEKFDRNTLNILTLKFLGNFPNTYCFTKNIAEHVADDMLKGQLPILIFRPSIVSPALEDEPVKGWQDNFNGPAGMLVAYGKGIMRTSYSNHDITMDYIPVDIVIKSLIVSAWDIAIRKNNINSEIINCVSSDYAKWIKLTQPQLKDTIYECNSKIPLNNALWTVSSHITSNWSIFYIRSVLFMLLPSLIVDGILKIAGKKPILTKLQRKIYIAQLAVNTFLTTAWHFNNGNFLALLKRIETADLTDWNFDFKDSSVFTYVEYSCLGARRYLLNESDDTIPSARKHYMRMYYIERTLQLIIIVIFIWYLFSL